MTKAPRPLDTGSHVALSGSLADDWSARQEWAPTDEWQAMQALRTLRSGTVADMLASHLAAEHVDVVFVAASGAHGPLHAALGRRSDIRLFSAQHQSAAVHMAAGYARVTGRLGVVVASTVPGIIDAMTGIASAYADAVPVLLVSTTTARGPVEMASTWQSTRLGVDTVAMLAPITHQSLMVHDAAVAEGHLQSSIRAALSGRPGPVHLSLPHDVAALETRYYAPQPLSYRPPELCEALRNALTVVLEGVQQARCPVILAGSGVDDAMAWSQLFDCATTLGIPVATTSKARGAFPVDHPLSLGVFGRRSDQRAREVVLNRADAVLVVGSSLEEWQTCARDDRFARRGKLVQIDIDPEQLGRCFPLRLGVVGDAAVALAELGSLARRRGFARQARPQDAPRSCKGTHGPQPHAPCAQQIGAAIARLCTDDTILFADVDGSVARQGDGAKQWGVEDAYVSLGFPTPGYGICAAIGAKLAAPRRPVVSLVSDSAFATSGVELRAAVDAGLHITWIVLNAGGYHPEPDASMFHHRVQATPGLASRSPLPATELARALGAAATTVTTYPQLCVALGRAFAGDEPHVIDVHLGPMNPGG